MVIVTRLIFYNIGLSIKNCYLWMREIHMVKMMKIIVYTKRIIDAPPNSLLNPKRVQLC
jgi:hypothetical protein